MGTLPIQERNQQIFLQILTFKRSSDSILHILNGELLLKICWIMVTIGLKKVLMPAIIPLLHQLQWPASTTWVIASGKFIPSLRAVSLVASQQMPLMTHVLSCLNVEVSNSKLQDAFWSNLASWKSWTGTVVKTLWSLTFKSIRKSQLSTREWLRAALRHLGIWQRQTWLLRWRRMELVQMLQLQRTLTISCSETMCKY